MLGRAVLLRFVIISALLALLLGACGGGDGGGSSKKILHLQHVGMEPMGDGYHYQGWALLEGQPVSWGKFNVLPNGVLTDTARNLTLKNQFYLFQRPGGPGSAKVAAQDFRDATEIFVTIEEPGDLDSIPSATRFMGGAVIEGVANMIVAPNIAEGDVFTMGAGSDRAATYGEKVSGGSVSAVATLR